MVCCEVDKEVPGEALGWPLPVWQAEFCHRFIPSCCGLLVFITYICFNFANIFENFKEGSNASATIGIILAILPAIGGLIFTLASPPPGCLTEESDLMLNIGGKELKWIFLEILKSFTFPITAICRYSYLIFWSMEVVCSSYYKDETRIKEALEMLRAPSPTELYLFLQAFIHAAPDALINLVQLMKNEGKSSNDKIVIQSVSIVAALMRMASTAIIYRRFEREKICGRKYPWIESEKEKLIQNEIFNGNEETKPGDQHVDDETESFEVSVAEIKKNNRLTVMDNLDNIVYRKDIDKSYSFIRDLVQRESTDSDYLTPVSSNRDSEIKSTNQSEKPIPIWARIAPRRSKAINIDDNIITPPPAFPAPRPKSLAMWAEFVMENAESFPDRIAAPIRKRLHSVEPSDTSEDVPLPEREPRNFQRGLEPQDVVAALISYFGWHLFFVSRVLSIAVFLTYFPWIGLLVLLFHYQLMFLLLIIPQASTVRRSFYVFLAFVYIFCLLEFKIRFRHVRVWHVFWLILCTIETVVFTGVWLAVDSSMHFWWKNYVILVIFCGTSLSYLCLFVYFILLQPKEKIVYITNESQTQNNNNI